MSDTVKYDKVSMWYNEICKEYSDVCQNNYVIWWDMAKYVSDTGMYGHLGKGVIEWCMVI